jgi:DNA polymerase III epsilon subunit-like protein
MRILVLDTETTGLPPREPLSQHNLPNWPSIVQCSFVVVDTETDKTTEYDFIIAVESVKGSNVFHGITDRRSKIMGYMFKDVYKILSLVLMTVDLVVGHNLQFDLNVIQADCMRHDLPVLKPPAKYCTMRETTAMCNIKMPHGGIKFPKLIELVQFLFHEDPRGLHNSLIDVYACLCCFYKVHLKRSPPAKFLKRLNFKKPRLTEKKY